jgi:molybdate transport system permease protein
MSSSSYEAVVAALAAAREPLLLSLQVATIATVGVAVVGIALAALLSNVRFPGRDVLDVILTAPMVLPPTVLGYYVLVVLGRRSFIGQAFERITGDPIVFTKTGAVVAAMVGALPLVVKSGRAALEATDATLVQAARTLGAGPFYAFVTIQLPLATRGIVAALMLAFARSLGDFGVTLMVAGDIPGETQTASLAIYDAIQGRRDGEALIMVIVLTSIAVATLYSVNKLTARRDGGW